MNGIINFKPGELKATVAYLPSTATGVSVGGTVSKDWRADGGGRMDAEGLSPCLWTLSAPHGSTFIILYHKAGVPETMSARTYSSHPVPFKKLAVLCRVLFDAGWRMSWVVEDKTSGHPVTLSNHVYLLSCPLKIHIYGICNCNATLNVHKQLPV